MADEIVAKGGSSAQFEPHPEGQFAAVCVDAIDLGERLETFPGSEPKVSHKAAILFRSGALNAAGQPIDIGVEYTVSMNEKANLRKFLEAMRGKKYTEEQAEAGVPLHKLVGHPALISVVHGVSRQNRTYAKIQAVMPLPKAMAAPEVGEYRRPAYYADRKKEYADEVRRWRGTQNPAPLGDDDMTGGDDDLSDLPY